MNMIQFNELKKRVLDFSECRTWDEIHGLIQDELELPEWYGQNLAALWDSLTGIMYVPADVTIIYRPEATKRSEEVADDIRKIITIFERAVTKYNEITLSVDM